jgi:drug/metabolite transporter (DMT)-like permease
MSAATWGLLVCLSLLWGGSFFFVGVAVRDVPPLTIAACRVGLAAAILWLFLTLRGQRQRIGSREWLAFLGMGILNNVVPFSLFVLAQTQIASGLAAILNATTPLFTVLAAHVFTHDEKLTPARGLGVGVGFLGVAVMMGQAAFGAAATAAVATQLACLAAAISYALAGVFGRRFRGMGLHPLTTAAGQVTVSSAILLPLAWVLEQPASLPMPSWQSIAAIIALAGVSTAFAYGIYFEILARAGATNLLLVTFLIPVNAMSLGVVVLGETVSGRQLLGMGLIGLGLAAIDGRPRNWARRIARKVVTQQSGRKPPS